MSCVEQVECKIEINSLIDVMEVFALFYDKDSNFRAIEQ